MNDINQCLGWQHRETHLWPGFSITSQKRPWHVLRQPSLDHNQKSSQTRQICIHQWPQIGGYRLISLDWFFCNVGGNPKLVHSTLQRASDDPAGLHAKGQDLQSGLTSAAGDKPGQMSAANSQMGASNKLSPVPDSKSDVSFQFFFGKFPIKVVSFGSSSQLWTWLNILLNFAIFKRASLFGPVENICLKTFEIGVLNSFFLVCINAKN